MARAQARSSACFSPHAQLFQEAHRGVWPSCKGSRKDWRSRPSGPAKGTLGIREGTVASVPQASFQSTCQYPESDILHIEQRSRLRP